MAVLEQCLNKIKKLLRKFQNCDTNVEAVDVKCNASLQDCFFRSWMCVYTEKPETGAVSRSVHKDAWSLSDSEPVLHGIWQVLQPDLYRLGMRLHMHEWSYHKQAAKYFFSLLFFLLLFYPAATLGWAFTYFLGSTCNYEV